MFRLVAAIGSFLMLLPVSSRAEGRPEAAQKIKVLEVQKKTSASFLLRLQGQLSDLPWRVERSRDDDRRRSPAEARVRLDPAGPDLEVVLTAAGGRRYRRSLTGLGQGSAALEAAAIVVRSALVALAAGRKPAMTADPPLASEDRAMFGLRGSLRAETWGLGPGTVGIDAGVFLRQGVFAWDLGATGRWPQGVEDGLTRSVLNRYELLAGLRFDEAIDGRWGWAAGLHGGLALWHRRTEVFDDEAVARSRLESWIAGTVVRARFGGMQRISERIGVEFAIGLDVFPGAPNYRYEGERTDTVAEPWVLQPWLAVGIRWDPIFLDWP